MFSGIDGSLIYALKSPGLAKPYATFGYRLNAVPDLNGDNTPEVLVSAPFQTVDALHLQGEVFCSTVAMVAISPPSTTRLRIKAPHLATRWLRLAMLMATRYPILLSVPQAKRFETALRLVGCICFGLGNRGKAARSLVHTPPFPKGGGTDGPDVLQQNHLLPYRDPQEMERILAVFRPVLIGQD